MAGSGLATTELRLLLLDVVEDLTRPDLTFYIDGSGVNTRWEALATFGFSIVIVAADGELVAWGNGIPPPWVDSAAGAEAWALAKTVKMAVHPPSIVTDCKSLLQVSRVGPTRARAATMPLARTWAEIVAALDGDLEMGSRLVDSLSIPKIAPSLGGVESLVEQPALMSYYELTTEQRRAIGIPDELIRYAVGLEDADDLVADLLRGLAQL